MPTVSREMTRRAIDQRGTRGLDAGASESVAGIVVSATAGCLQPVDRVLNLRVRVVDFRQARRFARRGRGAVAGEDCLPVGAVASVDAVCPAILRGCPNTPRTIHAEELRAEVEDSLTHVSGGLVDREP